MALAPQIFLLREEKKLSANTHSCVCVYELSSCVYQGQCVVYSVMIVERDWFNYVPSLCPNSLLEAE